jgi:hypothetical protein
MKYLRFEWRPYGCEVIPYSVHYWFHFFLRYLTFGFGYRVWWGIAEPRGYMPDLVNALAKYFPEQPMKSSTTRTIA